MIEPETSLPDSRRRVPSECDAATVIKDWLVITVYG